MPASQDNCFHCGLDIPKDVEITAVIKGKDRKMCCVGCQAVAMT
ncbi:MAG: heavy metal translocating P-type ATPase metal-binding domain-containing protein, partial [Pontibacterium sp.]